MSFHEEDVSVGLSLTIAPDGDYLLGVNLGARPYALVTLGPVDEDDEADDVLLTVQAGGGVPLDASEVVKLLGVAADAISEEAGLKPIPEDTAAAILAGLIETVRVMRQNAYAQGLTHLFADYDHAAEHLDAAAAYLPPFVADSHTDPIEKIAAQAAEEGGHREA